MGCRATEDGISLQFCDKDGNTDGAPIYGKYAALFGKKHKDILAVGRPPTPEEQQFPGSDDWLTLIAIADTKDKLDAIIHESVPDSDRTACETSGSSRRARIELHVGGIRDSFKDRITIASGPVVTIKPPLVDVVHIKAFPVGTRMDDKNPSFPEWEGMSILIQDQ